MNLADINTLEKLLKSEGFSFKKSLGQNFLIDPSVCPAMAEAACDKETGVIEIGPGVGVLTQELGRYAKKVVAIELDERLKKILPKTLAEFNNIKVIFGDAMKLDLLSIINEEFADCKRVCVCANLPYYITSPIIMQLLESKLPIDSITVMVQKEAGERLCATVGSRQAGAVTVAVSYFAEAEILFGVGRESFMPPPNVDSAVIQLKIRDKAPIFLKDEKKFFKFVKACFAQRRKTLINTVSNSLGVSKDKLRECLSELNLSDTVRSEQLTLDQLADLCNLLFN
ncbi:MAG: 16S rRNA (adenine(1518)-N(6)/adenine(1519)-N(6))-dimethyltransferase RsmA [Clostridia bacterium]|nr:16S rRNA (adenine(1518)-N(6)/adenine(1519)-N(6))-dimethyltransferase RsmA [Clostridia bacterium]MBQ7107042.1 16S rRNA (adenine(1518)-N(6)/adenine(1519)-N(6))-dimethyltransferase RsmA [Clostridia bacterium]